MEYQEDTIAEILRTIPVFVRKIHAGTIQHLSLTPAQLFVLILVLEKKSCRLSDISRELSISAPTATGIVDRLERDGYVKREHDNKDRRAVNVVLTKKGQKFISESHVKKFDRFRKILRILTPEERKQYLHILRKLVEGMDYV